MIQHPGVMLVAVILLTIAISFVSSLWLLVLICGALTALLLRRGFLNECWSFLKVMLVLSLPYLLLITFVGGGFRITANELQRVSLELLRIVDVGLLLLAGVYLLPSDRILLWLFSVAPRAGLVLAVAFRAVPRLRERFVTTVEAFEYRGLTLSRGNLRERTATLFRIVRSVLLTTLDECAEVVVMCELRNVQGNKPC